MVNDFSGNNMSWGCRCLGQNCEMQQEFRHPKVMCAVAPPQPHMDINPHQPVLAIWRPWGAP